MSATDCQRKPIIGLVGGIGAGKSSVAAILAELGAVVIDSDRVGHAVLEEPDVRETLRTWWPQVGASAGGGVDRQALARIVFQAPAERERLERLLYPRIAQRRAQRVAEALADPAVRAIVIDAPKLYEAGVDAECDRVLYVDTDRNHRLDRVTRSRGWSPEELIRRENQQDPLDSKKAKADYRIENNSDMADLRRRVEAWFTSLLADYSR